MALALAHFTSFSLADTRLHTSCSLVANRLHFTSCSLADTRLHTSCSLADKRLHFTSCSLADTRLHFTKSRLTLSNVLIRANLLLVYSCHLDGLYACFLIFSVMLPYHGHAHRSKCTSCTSQYSNIVAMPGILFIQNCLTFLQKDLAFFTV